VSEPKNKASAAASESGTHKPKRKKEKLIRLDDLLPKGNVTGGRQLLFGASDTQQPTQPDKE
jgi:hypothetical protein